MGSRIVDPYCSTSLRIHSVCGWFFFRRTGITSSLTFLVQEGNAARSEAGEETMGVKIETRASSNDRKPVTRPTVEKNPPEEGEAEVVDVPEGGTLEVEVARAEDVRERRPANITAR